MKQVFNKIFCGLGLLSLVAFTYMTLDLLPTIFESGIQGIFFLITIILFMIDILYLLITKPKEFIESISMHLFMMITTVYLLIIYLKLFPSNSAVDSNYQLNLDYCQVNFFILGLVLLMLILNSKLLVTTKPAKEKTKTRRRKRKKVKNS